MDAGRGMRRGGKKVAAEKVTRRSPTGMPGEQELGGAQIGGSRPSPRRGRALPGDSGGDPSEVPLASSARPKERHYEDDLELGAEGTVY